MRNPPVHVRIGEDGRLPLPFMEWFGLVAKQTQTRQVSLTPGNIPANSTIEATLTVPCSAGHQVIVSPPGYVAGVLVGAARISATDTVAVPFGNLTGGVLAAPSGDYTVTVIRP